LWEAQGDIRQAILHWELVDKADPGNTEARRHLNDLAALAALTENRMEQRAQQ
jgi:hypothetical protein